MEMIEAIKRLRQYAPKSVPGVRSELLLIADEIQAEIDARYMELPVDADGVPIRVGDYLQLGETRGEVVALTYCPSNGKLPWEWQCDMGDWYNTAFARHVKPRTVEQNPVKELLASAIPDLVTTKDAYACGNYYTDVSLDEEAFDEWYAAHRDELAKAVSGE